MWRRRICSQAPRRPVCAHVLVHADNKAFARGTRSAASSEGGREGLPPRPQKAREGRTGTPAAGRLETRVSGRRRGFRVRTSMRTQPARRSRHTSARQHTGTQRCCQAHCARPRPGGAADGSTELWVGSEGVTHRHDRLQHLKQARAPALAPTTAVSAQGGDFACDCERVPATTDGAGIKVYSGVRAHVRVTVRAEWPAVDDVPSEHHKVRPARAVRRV